MILVVCLDDPKLLKKAEKQSSQDRIMFGDCHVLKFRGSLPPKLGISENLFVTAHGSCDWEAKNAVIGDRGNTTYYFNGVDFYNRIKNIFPTDYRGNVYISACESADYPWDCFSFIEVFKSQIDVDYNVSVYGQKGKVGYAIPYPNASIWIEA
ncbi:hypothetical protein GCM10008904_00320 [Paraclostridium ghonii]|uniref:hypothetical protein n=1 Tax=Paraclostridium ghonii TaxID=29358 RepID=UPI0031D14ACE